MYVETVPNRNSPPAILLRESWREGKKTCKRTLSNMSHWPKQKIAALRAALKGGVVIADLKTVFVTVGIGLPSASQPCHPTTAPKIERKSRLPFTCQGVSPDPTQPGEHPSAPGHGAHPSRLQRRWHPKPVCPSWFPLGGLPWRVA